MLDAIKQTCQNYYDQIPKDTLPVIGKSALYSFSIALLFVDRTKPYDIVQPLVKGGIAVLATCIYSLTAPFFNVVFGDNRHLFHREFLKTIVNHAVTAMIYSSLTTGKVTLTALPLLNIVPLHTIFAAFDLFPQICDLIQEPQLAQYVRNAYASIGMDLVPGTASIQLIV